MLELAWTGDTAPIKTYKLPEAQRFARTFCANVVDPCQGNGQYRAGVCSSGHLGR